MDHLQAESQTTNQNSNASAILAQLPEDSTARKPTVTILPAGCPEGYPAAKSLPAARLEQIKKEHKEFRKNNPKYIQSQQ